MQRRNGLQHEVLAYLEKHSGMHSAREVTDALGSIYGSTKQALNDLTCKDLAEQSYVRGWLYRRAKGIR